MKKQETITVKNIFINTDEGELASQLNERLLEIARQQCQSHILDTAENMQTHSKAACETFNSFIKEIPR